MLETQTIAELALRVLRGERADSIAVGSRTLSVPQVDWRQLRRWGIGEGRVPVGTLITFREPTWKLPTMEENEYPTHFFTSLNDLARCES